VGELNEPISLIDWIIANNRTIESLNALRTQAHANDTNLRLEDGLLLFQDRLIVPNIDNLYTDLIKEAYN
jgi:hypothetical protein